MTNREESDAAEHETYPGPGPLRADEARRGIHPVEQMVDAAIDRIAREYQASRDGGEASSALALAPVESVSTALASASSARRANARLRWKGLDVSDEFRSYADRIARGEELPPFTGKILAEPDPAFPWDPSTRRRAEGRALKQQFGLWTGVALFLGVCVWVLVVQVSNQTDAAQKAAESPLATLVLGNQPSPAPAAPDVAASDPSASDPRADTSSDSAAANAAALDPRAAAAPLAAVNAPPTARGTTALVSLRERPSPAPRASTPSSSAMNAGVAANSVGVFVATRSASNDMPSTGVGTIARTPPGALDVAAGSSGRVLAEGGNTASAAANAPVAAAPSPAEAANRTQHADPKKEPGREASTMGPLLVETPSF